MANTLLPPMGGGGKLMRVKICEATNGSYATNGTSYQIVKKTVDVSSILPDVYKKLTSENFCFVNLKALGTATIIGSGITNSLTSDASTLTYSPSTGTLTYGIPAKRNDAAGTALISQVQADVWCYYVG